MGGTGLVGRGGQANHIRRRGRWRGRASRRGTSGNRTTACSRQQAGLVPAHHYARLWWQRGHCRLASHGQQWRVHVFRDAQRATGLHERRLCRHRHGYRRVESRHGDCAVHGSRRRAGAGICVDRRQDLFVEASPRAHEEVRREDDAARQIFLALIGRKAQGNIQTKLGSDSKGAAVGGVLALSTILAGFADRGRPIPANIAANKAYGEAFKKSIVDAHAENRRRIAEYRTTLHIDLEAR